MVIMVKHRKIKKLATEPPCNEEDSSAKLPQELAIIAQEVKIVQSLACNDVNKRNRQLRKLSKWLSLRNCSSFTFSEEDFLRIWKGLYYNMWMSDKPLVQEELAEKLGKLLECFKNDVKECVNFFGAFLRTMCHQWFGIDQWRIDKFLMLVRRMLRSMFRTLKDVGWTAESIKLFNAHMQQTVLAENAATGLTMHYLDIFCEELAKVSDGSISAKQVGLFLRPFVKFMGRQSDFKLISHCRTHIFYHLLYQSSLGREYIEKYNAWKEMGFPTASINDLEKVENSASLLEDGLEEVPEQANAQKHLDPRAGNIDVFMPELPLDGATVTKELNNFISKEECNTKCRKMLKKMLRIFETYESGVFPLGVKTMPRILQESEKPLIKDKIQQLENLENDVYGTGRKLKQMNKRKRRKLLNALSYENADESNFDQMVEKAIPKQYLKERRKRTQSAMMTGWVEEELSVDELQQPKQVVHPKKPKRNATALGETNGDEPKLKKIKKRHQLVNTTNIITGAATKTTTTAIFQAPQQTPSEWDTPLQPGEIEHFIPSRRTQLNTANVELVRNPLAPSLSSPISSRSTADASFLTQGGTKRVKIALKNNTAQNPSEYLKQIQRSPKLPYDASKKPGKGLLKPNLKPSPIHPKYNRVTGHSLYNTI